MKVLVITIFLSLTCVLNAQVNDEDVLFTVDDMAVKAKEFIRVYNKNLDLVQDESQKDIDAYLELFINYKLKIKEARRLELDKGDQYLREFGNYKKQLTKNYMTDNKVTDALVKEAYERTTNDINASHILIRLDESEKDTIKVYNNLLELRKRIIKEGFETVQSEVHDGKTIIAEDLGYFGGFKMVYPFETAAFSTPVGEVSMPFRTRFGYHIVNVVDKRKALGEVTVAHIMVALKQKDSTVDPETRIRQIYQKLEQGEKFESLAKQFSDDQSSASKGGALSPFVGGQLSSKPFEDVAFSLEQSGDVSKPFKTNYGWHIVKLIRKQGIQPFSEVETELKNKVQRDSRSKLIKSSMAKKLMGVYTVIQNKEGLSYFESKLTDDFFNQAWTIPVDIDEDQPLITINDAVITYKDFGNYLMQNQRKYYKNKQDIPFVVKQEYEVFLEAKILEYREENLEIENEDFAFVLGEYRDGLLLFELMEKEVWNAASKDSVGLQKYFDEHKSNYVWKDRIDAVVLSSASKETIEKVKMNWNEEISEEEILSMMNTDGDLKVISTHGVLEKGAQTLPENFEFTEGISKVFEHNDAYHVVKVKEVLPAGYKSLKEARGKVVSDYQSFIEERWVKGLQDQFKVRIDSSILKRVKKQILN